MIGIPRNERGIEMSDLFAKCKCPYCGHITAVYLKKEETYRPFLVLCEIEEGPGCDRYYIVKARVSVTTKSFPVDLEVDG